MQVNVLVPLLRIDADCCGNFGDGISGCGMCSDSISDVAGGGGSFGRFTLSLGSARDIDNESA